MNKEPGLALNRDNWGLICESRNQSDTNAQDQQMAAPLLTAAHINLSSRVQ